MGNRLRLRLRLRSGFSFSTLILIFLFCTPVVYARVVTTKHNLSVSGPGTIKADVSTGETEICVFCHTPHHTVAVSEGPLWNHSLSSANYIVPSNEDPGRTTMLSTPGQPDLGAKLCLGCHDGTVAIGMVVNTPGPGSRGPIAMESGTTTIPPGSTNLTTDLSGHHPVSVAINTQLRDDKLAQCAESIVFFYIDFPEGAVKLRPTNNLYLDQYPGVLIKGKPSGIQCASCHNPHNDPIGKFLVDDKNSLCIECHKDCP